MVNPRERRRSRQETAKRIAPRRSNEGQAGSGLTGDRAEIYRLHRLFVEGNETWELEPWIDNVAEDVIAFVGDGSVWRGREQVRKEWSITGELIEGRWRLETSDLVIETFAEAAWVVYEFHLHGVLAGEPFDRRGRGTELYRRRDGRWLMAVAHFSWIQ